VVEDGAVCLVGGRGRKPRRKDDSDDSDSIGMDDVEPVTAQRVSIRRTTRKKPVLQFSSDDDDDDFEESATKGVFVF